MGLWMLLGLMADAIFDSAAARGRAYEMEIDRYFARRGLRIGTSKLVSLQ